MDMGADVEIVQGGDGDNANPSPSVAEAAPPADDAASTQDTADRGHDENSDALPSAEAAIDAGPNGTGPADDDGAAQRPTKRRKLDDGTPRRSASRAASPPWRSFQADGPTTIIIDGIRKSSRVNREKETPAPTPPPPAAAAAKHSHSSTARTAFKTAPANGAAKHPSKPGHARTPSATTAAKARGAPVSSKKAAVASSPPSRKSERQRKPSKTALGAAVHPPATPEATRTRSGRQSRRPAQAATDDGEDAHSTPYQNQYQYQYQYSDGFDATSPADGSTQRIRLRLKKRDPPNRHPAHAPKPPQYTSFADWLQHDDPLDGEEKERITPEKAAEEARQRLRIVEAAESGVLSQNRCSIFHEEPADELPPRYGHWHHVVAHAEHFQKLLRKERARHQKEAKTLAREAYEYWKEKFKKKSQEEIDEEEKDRAVLRYKQLVKDVKDSWANVKIDIDKERIAKWEEEQLQLGHKAMDHMFNQAQVILGRNMADSASSFVSDDRSELDEEFDSDASHASDGEQLDDVMSSSGASDSEENQDGDEDANLTAEQLREKYAHIPDLEPELSEDDESEHDDEDDDDEDRTPEPTPDPDIEMEDAASTAGVDRSNGHDGPDEADVIDPATVELEEVDAALLDTSEESGSEEWSDGDESEDDRSEAASDSASEEGDGLGVMGFLSAAEIKKMKEAAKAGQEKQSDPDPQEETAAVNGSGDHEENEPPARPTHINGDTEVNGKADDDEPVFNKQHEEKEAAKTVFTETTPPIKEAEQQLEEEADEELGRKPVEEISKNGTASGGRSRHTSSPPRTEIPSLLRGTLREYQHDGLDWLANLYDSDTNGILADEMGLGKTIQTISLLAYIAVHRGIWGPHLVVVPTSVMLNWEMEFKKWCPGFKILTYYGDIAERKRKRSGWRTTGKDMYNVVITSYQLILQDAAAFKMRAWEYLILDEAHNIKNFKSQRWQTMLTLRTERRLLLTGTPLQNNIDELWSLLYFLMPSGFAGEGRIAGLEEFTNALKNPTSQILDQGRQQLDAEAQKIVKKLHEVLRPYLLRRLKADVEKQMPAKYEHVVYCKLSKRQRQLYDGFMGRASTKQILSSGNYMSIINCLMSLRKVCNHPDLFETRAIVTSMAMPKSVPAQYEIKDLLIRRRLQKSMDEELNLDALNLVFAHREKTSMLHARRMRQIRATRPLEDLVARQTRRLKPPSEASAPTIQSAISAVQEKANIALRDHFQHCLDLTRSRTQFLPIYGKGLIGQLTMDYQDYAFGAHDQAVVENGYLMRPASKKGQYGFRAPRSPRFTRDWNYNQIMLFHELVPTLEQRSEALEPTVTRFTCVTPAVAAEEVAALTVSKPVVEMVRSSPLALNRDPFHESRIRQSIAFPDKRLLQYDCGKLQRLAVLLRDLQAGGHRALIFTQMTKVLDILEQFLNIHGHRYLRLDGATKVEQRQILTDRFNNDPRILCFILSSRSGGLGINLTGADTVIFYDLDWNPAMDKQCQDRSHRIGQTRDVHIYKFVSEYTIEANILRKSNQKRLLDDVIIQKGDFTTDYFNKVTWRDALDSTQHEPVDEAGAAMDRVLGEKAGLLGDAKVMRSVEDTEDQNAAQTAQKEIVDEIHDDHVDFNESSSGTPAGAATRQQSEAGDGGGGKDGTGKGGKDSGNRREELEIERRHVDEYMLDWYREEYGKEPYKPPTDRQRRRNRKGHDVHRTHKKRKY